MYHRFSVQILIFAALLSSSATQAAVSPSTPSPASALDYGSLYLLESREVVPSHWEMGLAYGTELSNPYLNIGLIDLRGVYSFSPFIGIGAELNSYSSSENEVARVIGRELAQQGILQSVRSPKLSAFALVPVTPLSGHLNFFSLRSIPVDFVITLGGGAISYAQGPAIAAIKWALSPRVMVYKGLGAEASLGQEVEQPFSSPLARTSARLGAFVKF